MGYHHVAIATRDIKATHAFYTTAMGFELVRAEKARTGANAWAKHFFYDTGNGEMMAFWEIHDETLPDDFPTSISTGLGLPTWTNHIAFSGGGRSLADRGRGERLLAAGHKVRAIDHHWCKSIYAMGPERHPRRVLHDDPRFRCDGSRQRARGARCPRSCRRAGAVRRGVCARLKLRPGGERGCGRVLVRRLLRLAVGVFEQLVLLQVAAQLVVRHLQELGGLALVVARLGHRLLDERDLERLNLRFEIERQLALAWLAHDIVG